MNDQAAQDLAVVYDQVTARDAAAPDRVREALAGDWRQFDDELHARGAQYARTGLALSACHALVDGLRADLVPALVAAYAPEPARLKNALVALDDFCRRVTTIVTEQYLDTRQRLSLEAGARHSSILEASLDPVISMDDRGIITDYNAAAERAFGHRRLDVIGRLLADVLLPERLRAAHTAGLARYLTTGTHRVLGKRLELTAIRADGSELPVEVAIVPLTSAHTRRQFTGFIRDLTESKQAEHSQLLWAHVFENALFGIVMTEIESRRIHGANDAYARMLGYTADELIGQSAMKIVPRETVREATAITMIQSTIQRQGHHTFEMRLLRKDGTTFTALISSSTLPTRAGEPPLRISTVVDMTERKEFEAVRAASADLLERTRKIEESSRLKSEFLANMSNELRTPLNSIIGFAELLHDGEVGTIIPEQKEFLGYILTSGRHLLQLINDVLDLSKVEAGKLEFHPDTVDLGRLVAEVISILGTAAAQKRLQIATSIADLGPIVLDASRLKQVLYNYLSNALKFTPPGGVITVRAMADGPAGFRLEVQDTGIGIAEPDLDRLFVEFQQLDSGATKAHGGTGLGLALTKRLVEAQGGTVGARSEVGKGSRFHAVLPRRSVGRRRTSPTTAATLVAARSAPARVLVVEDDPGDQATIAQAVVDAGYAVDVVATGAEAIAKCQGGDYAAVTLDLILPDVSGLDVLKAIRLFGRNPTVPIVVVTVVTERATAGFVVHDVLAKPIDRDALVRSLRAITPTPAATVIVDDREPDDHGG